MEAVESSKQKDLEAEALNFRALMGCLNQENLNKLMEAKAKCVQKKYFRCSIDKIISLRRNFAKALVILSWFLLLFLLLFLLT